MMNEFEGRGQSVDVLHDISAYFLSWNRSGEVTGQYSEYSLPARWLLWLCAPQSWYWGWTRLFSVKFEAVSMADMSITLYFMEWTPHILLETCRQENLLSWRWWQQVPLKRWHPFIWICGLMSQTTASCRFVWFWTWSRSWLLRMWVWHSVVLKFIHIC
jgi:hypothetical protein